jgi:hypothetical protein
MKEEKPVRVSARTRASTRADSDSGHDDDEEEVSAAGTYQCVVKARSPRHNALPPPLRATP